MKSIIIAIAGGSGSGKTTVVNKIISHFKNKEVCVLRSDDYYKKMDLPYEERAKTNFDHPDSIDFDLLVSHIKELKEGRSIEKPIYDFKISNRTDETEHIEPSPIIIIEGILVLEEEEIRNLSDIKIYVDTDSDLRFIRRLIRDINERGRTLDSVVNKYLKTVKPMHEAFVERTKKYADIIIPNDFSHNVAVDIVETKIKEIIKAEKENKTL